MPTLVEKQERQKRLIYIVICAILIGAVVLYIGFFRKTKGEEASKPVIRKSKVLESTGLDTSTLRDPKLIELRPYIRLLPDIQAGRTNPFSPYGEAMVFEAEIGKTVFEEGF